MSSRGYQTSGGYTPSRPEAIAATTTGSSRRVIAALDALAHPKRPQRPVCARYPKSRRPECLLLLPAPDRHMRDTSSPSLCENQTA